LEIGRSEICFAAAAAAFEILSEGQSVPEQCYWVETRN
jgi:hypothetical protein